MHQKTEISFVSKNLQNQSLAFPSAVDKLGLVFTTTREQTTHTQHRNVSYSNALLSASLWCAWLSASFTHVDYALAKTSLYRI